MRVDLSPRRCALLVIDLQERLMKAIHKADRVSSRAVLMIRAAQVFGLPVVATTQYVKGLGGFVQEVSEVLEGVEPLDKVEFDCFSNAGVRSVFQGLPASVDTVFLVGVESHICVYQSALGARKMGLEPWIVSDAVSSRDKANHKAALRRFMQLGISFGPAEMAIYQLMRMAGTEEFKAMLPHVK